MRHKTCVNARRLLQRAGWMPEFVAIEVRRRRKIPARVKDLKVRQVRRWRAAASAGSAIGEPGGGKPGHGEPQGHGVPPQTRRIVPPLRRHRPTAMTTVELSTQNPIKR